MAVAPRFNWLKSRWPYFLGKIVLHLFVAGLFGLTMLEWQR